MGPILWAEDRSRKDPHSAGNAVLASAGVWPVWALAVAAPHGLVASAGPVRALPVVAVGVELPRGLIAGASPVRA
ncbi:MAG: hypothetical protein QOE71_2543, partial [Pseudonocardiales bacterium]|nr:hypothetical protein [Pseudonocardiales bacterium]